MSNRVPDRRATASHSSKPSGSDDFLDKIIVWESLGAVITEHRLAIAAIGAGLALLATVGFDALPQEGWLHHTPLLLFGRGTLLDLGRALHALAVPLAVAAGALLVTDALLAMWPRRRTPWHVLIAVQPFLPLPLLAPLLFYIAVVVINVVVWVALGILAACLVIGFLIGFIQSLFQST